MPIQPIQGAFKRRALLDIIFGVGVGGVMASYWWWGFHKSKIDKREAFYAQLAESKKQQD